MGEEKAKLGLRFINEPVEEGGEWFVEIGAEMRDASGAGVQHPPKRFPVASREVAHGLSKHIDLSLQFMSATLGFAQALSAAVEAGQPRLYGAAHGGEA